ncbi:hypothetical protein ACLI4Q_19665 [Natrialbaceae archaeon A-CW1-1]
MDDKTDRSDQQEPCVKRRDVMKAAGISVVGLGAAAGTASANGRGRGNGNGERGPPAQYSTYTASDGTEIRYRFFGCSQVCVDTGRIKAAVDRGTNGCRTPTISEPEWNPEGEGSDRGNLWDGDIYCLEVSDPEAVVGFWYFPDGSGEFVANDHRCAENYTGCSPVYGDN